MEALRRRTTQTILQQIGLADKTQDDIFEAAHQNFLSLGAFASQLKTNTQDAESSMEKMCTTQARFAGQIEAYLHNVLGEHAGELNDYFQSSNIPDAKDHAKILQDSTEKFYIACNEIGFQMRTLVGKLDEVIVKPISRDEEYNNISKELIEEKKKSMLDYDSYRRAAASSMSADDKVRSAKDRLELASRKVLDHFDQRNNLRCKILLHGILTAIQQYHSFYVNAAENLRETVSAIKPLLDAYQLSDAQLANTLILENNKPGKPYKPNRSQSQSQLNTKPAAESIFDEQEKHLHSHNGNPLPPRPSLNPNKPPSGTSPAPPARTASPQPPPAGPQIDALMEQQLMDSMKKPSATSSQRPKGGPMNQVKPINTSQNQTRAQSNPGQPPNTLKTSQGIDPPISTLGRDPFLDDWPSAAPSVAATQPPSGNSDVFFDLRDLNNPTPSTSSVTPPANPGSALLDDLLNFTPPIQPNPSTPIQPNRNSPTPPKTTQPPPQRPFNSTTPPVQPKSNPQPPSFDFEDMFGPSPTSTSHAQPPLFNGGPSSSAPSSSAPNVSAHVGQDQEERQELNPAITEKIKNWAERGGRQGNLRSLLSTLHEVIWVDSGWDALPLSELITPSQVKKAYLRANKIVHPDKIITGTVEQKLIAQRLFEALREAYTKEPIS